MCQVRTKKGGFCKRKSSNNSTFCSFHSKKILKEIEVAQNIAKEKSEYARTLYQNYLNGTFSHKIEN